MMRWGLHRRAAATNMAEAGMVRVIREPAILRHEAAGGNGDFRAPMPRPTARQDAQRLSRFS